MNVTGYQIFLMVELARIAGVIDRELEYDTTWAMGQMLYSEFENSDFDDSNQPEYECIEKFLLDYKSVNEQLERFLSICEKVDKNVSDEYVTKQLGKGIYNLNINDVYYWVDGNFYTITNDNKLILNIGNGLKKVLSYW